MYKQAYTALYGADSDKVATEALLNGPDAAGSNNASEEQYEATFKDWLAGRSTSGETITLAGGATIHVHRESNAMATALMMSGVTAAHSLCLRFNKDACDCTCPVCHKVFRSDLGLMPFVEGTDHVVCKTCAEKHQPELAEICRERYDREAEREQELREMHDHIVWEAATKPLRELVQLDGFAGEHPEDDLMRPDSQGYSVMGSRAYELFNATWNIRLFMRTDTTRQQALDLLTRMQEWIQREGDWPMFEQAKLPRMTASDDDESIPF